ncbi:hypothetical protein KIL84_002733 [Mauremys mutica]|uniref:Uncharacterized protein n=1 Tax=Mauremys mutica TaxID=74926 RepID=A0A9D4ASW5_9SAUR|nr:hypothetical protein KIL84_002733 [Mauremys mutica]
MQSSGEASGSDEWRVQRLLEQQQNFLNYTPLLYVLNTRESVYCTLSAALDVFCAFYFCTVCVNITTPSATCARWGTHGLDSEIASEVVKTCESTLPLMEMVII